MILDMSRPVHVSGQQNFTNSPNLPEPPLYCICFLIQAHSKQARQLHCPGWSRSTLFWSSFAIVLDDNASWSFLRLLLPKLKYFLHTLAWTSSYQVPFSGHTPNGVMPSTCSSFGAKSLRVIFHSRSLFPYPN